MAKIIHNPRSRRILKRFVIDGKYNPYNPSAEILKEINEWALPSSNYIKKDIKGKYIYTLEPDELCYVAFSMIRGLPEIKLIARMLYFIRYATDEEISKKDLYEDITDLDNEGFVPKMFASHLEPD